MKVRFIYFPIFLLAAILVYFSTITSNYGFRDDYSITRETHEEPGKILVFTASHARPLYGVFLELSYRFVDSIDDLSWFRLLSALFISGFGLALFRQLQENGWQTFESVAAALVVMYLPASQVTVSWAVGWPWGISLILTVIGFRLTEEAWTKEGLRRTGFILCAVLVYLLSTAIYQSNTLFAVPLLASLLLSPAGMMTTAQAFKRSVFHLVILFVGLLASFIILKMMFAAGIFQASGRLQFEMDIYSKLQWFVFICIPNSAAFITLRDDFNTGAILFWSVFSVFMALIFFSFYKNIQSKNSVTHKPVIWLVCLFILPWIAHSISLAAAERALGYRTTFALSGLFVILLFTAIREIFPKKVQRIVISLLVMISAIQAYQQSYHLIAQPQAREWGMIKDAVKKIKPYAKTRIYLIEPHPKDRSTERVYRDEYGSFTTNSSWAPDEMFKQALRERFVDGLPKGWRYEFRHGGEVPSSTARYHHIIDMRKLSQWRN